MKNLFAVATLLFTTAASQASPTLGDYANYAVVLVNGSKLENGSYKVSLTRKTSSGFVMSTNMATGEKVQKSTKRIKAEDLMDDQKIADVLNNCDKYKGRVQRIRVPAGSFKTCAVLINSGTGWIGQVPFGIVKQIQPQEDGATLVMELNNFSRGKN